jgi:hypothetical protein
MKSIQLGTIPCGQAMITLYPGSNIMTIMADDIAKNSASVTILNTYTLSENTHFQHKHQRRNDKVRLAIIILLAILFAANIQAATYYIDPTAGPGGDGNIESPFDAWSDVTWAPGNSYLQKRGTTSSAQIQPRCGGSVGNYITIGAYGTGNKPIISGVTGSGIYLGYGSTQKSYIIIENLDVRNSMNCGIQATVASNVNHILIDSVDISGTNGYGITIPSTTGTNIEIRNCKLTNIGLNTNPVYGIIFTGTGKAWIHHNTINGVGRAGTSDNSDGISLGAPIGGNGCIIEYNTITGQHGISGSGIDLAHSLNTDNASISATCRYNTISDCEGRCIGLMGDSLNGSQVLIYSNYMSSSPMAIYCYQKFTGFIYNNTIENITDNEFWFSATHDTDGPRTVYFKNNIVSGDSTNKIVWSPNGASDGPYILETDYNDFYAPSSLSLSYNGLNYHTLLAWQTATSQDWHSISSNPHLGSIPAAARYLLSVDSPCRDAGIAVPKVVTDITGYARPVGTNYDIGCYEWRIKGKPTGIKVQLR